MKFHRIPIQLRFSDFDMLRHVNNAKFATYIELSRIAFFDEVIAKNHNWNETGLIQARLELDFKAPVYWGEQLYVETGVAAIGNKSMNLVSRIYAGDSAENLSLRAEGVVVVVCFHFPQNQSIPVPEAWKLKLEAWNLTVNK